MLKYISGEPLEQEDRPGSCCHSLWCRVGRFAWPFLGKVSRAERHILADREAKQGLPPPVRNKVCRFPALDCRERNARVARDAGRAAKRLNDLIYRLHAIAVR